MKINYILAILLLSVITISCQNNDEPKPVDPFKDLVKLYSMPTAVGAIKMDVYLKEDLFAGYNKVYLSVYDSVSGETASGWTMSFSPLMTMMTDMGMMQHTCPTEQPVYNREMKAYEGAIIFVMPSTSMGNWELAINYQNPIGEGKISFPVVVQEKENSAIKSFVSEADETVKYFVANIQPELPDVGINDFEIGIYSKESMMSFPAVDDLSITIDPLMPSMNHGSPENVNPVSIGNGKSVV